ncbi:hypothetical protein BB560_002363 [Smittium megazygosporum]|uniref:Uncharacterized protein n=1 Tax=Smittium megazygosporum TaxID=133381 RepID=A0A2T9ZF13_9FUNG|nr:hypothetical protein BB560_002363 [Smittium megazygosporum]
MTQSNSKVSSNNDKPSYIRLNIIKRCIGKYRINDNTKIGYLIRNLLNRDIKIGSQRINKLINGLIDFIELDNEKKKPKTCTLVSTLAITAGATYEDVVPQGFWSSRGIFEMCYQLSRRSRDSMTTLVLGNSLLR